MRFSLSILILLAMVLLAVFSYRASLSISYSKLDNGAELTPVQCWFDVPDHQRVECAWFHTRKTGYYNRFQLPVVVIRHANWKNDDVPMLYLEGGPGGAAGLDPVQIQWWMEVIDDNNWGHDLVLYDQRAVGLSQPSYRCPNLLEIYKTFLAQRLPPAEEERQYHKELKYCLRRLSENGARLEELTTKTNAQDAADLMELLHQGKWHLYGISYGTRIGLEIERLYPELAQSLILDSVYPADKDGYSIWPKLFGLGIERLLQGSNGKSFEQRKQQLLALMERLNNKPIELDIKRVNGQVQHIVIDPERFLSILFTSSYFGELAPKAAMLIDQLHENGEENSLLKEFAEIEIDMDLDESFTDAVFLAISCQEAAPDSKDTFVDNVYRYLKDYVQLMAVQLEQTPYETCALLPRDEAHQANKQSVVTNKPVLILAGGYDSITPAQWARELDKQLPNSHLEYVPNAAHGLSLSESCIIRAIGSFVSDTAHYKQSCVVN